MTSAATPAPPISPLGEIRERFRAVETSESGPDRDRYVEALKAFLASAEGHLAVLASDATEVAPLIDEAAMAFYRASMPEFARRAVDLGLRLSPSDPSLLHHKALVLLALNEDLPTAVQLVDQALAARPHDKGLWATKGDALRLLGKNAEAAKAYLNAQRADASSTQYVERALKLAPTDPEVLRLKVELARSGGDRKALEACDALLKESPDDLELHRIRAELLVALGTPGEALVPIARVREHRPDDPALAALHLQALAATGKADEAWSIASGILQSTVEPSGPTLEKVAQLCGSERPEIALAARERLRAIEPRNIKNLHELRRLAAQLGRNDAALAACRAVLVASPENLEAMRGIAELESAAGHVEEALEAYRAIAKAHPQATGELSKALEYACEISRPESVREFANALLSANPKDARAQLELARALAAAGDLPGSAKAYDGLLAEKPGDIALLIEKKEILSRLSAPAELASVLDELFRLDPTRTDVAVDRGNLYLALAYDLPEGSAERERAARAALVSYERASSDPEAADVSLLGIARASRLVDDRERALRSYADYLARAGNDARHDVRKELAQTLAEAGRPTEAEAEYERAISGGLEDPDLFWGAVETYAQLGKDAPALFLLDLLLTKQPSNPLFLRRKGQLLLRAGRREEALGTFREAVGSTTNDPHAQFDVAETLRAQGAYLDAVAYYRRGLEADPADRHGRLALAETLFLAGQYPEVLALVDPLLKEDTNDLAAWKARADALRALGRPSEVLYSLQAILLLDPDDLAALLETYRLRRDAGETKEAFDALTRLLRSNAPEAKDPTLQLERGDLAAALGQPDEANASYERAAAIDPAFRVEVAIRRARLRLSAGRPDLALEVLDQGLRSVGDETPPSVGALLLRAEILAALERPAEARAVYEAVRAREPRSPVAVAGIGQSMIAEGRHADAAEFLRGALPTLPPQEALFLELAEAESGIGRLDEAAGAVAQGVQLLPKSVTLWSRLGEIAIARQLWTDAANAFAHALGLSPTSIDLLLRAGFVASRLEHPNEALSFYERATQVDPTSKQAWTNHGLALLTLGRPAEAQPSFERALAIDSDYAPAKDGKKLSVQKTRDAQVQRYGREALTLEAKLHRPVTKNDLFVTLHVPFEFLAPVLTAIGQTPKLDLDRLGEGEVRDLEGASYQLIVSALEHRPPGIERRGLTLADVAVLAPPANSLAQIQRLFGYLRAVLEADLRPENLSLAADVEELARRALALPAEQRTLFQLVRTLRVGIYKARLIKAVEKAGATAHAPLPTLDLGAFSPEFRAPDEPGSAAGAGGRPPTQAPDGGTEVPASPHGAPAGRGGAPLTEGAEGTLPRRSGGGGSEGRCVGCGGIASHRHLCGSVLCRTCVGQFPKCPKCGQPVSHGSLEPLAGPAPPSTAAAPGGTESAGGAARRSKSAPSPPSRAATHDGGHPEEHKGEGKGEHAPHAARASSERAEAGEEGARTQGPSGAKGPSDEGSPPVAKPRREKHDDEPRL